MIIRACPELEVEMLADTQGCTGHLEVRVALGVEYRIRVPTAYSVIGEFGA